MTTRRTRAVAVVGATALIVVGTVVGLGAGAGDRNASAQSTGGATAKTVATATVETRDLVERETVSGTLGYGNPRDVPSAAQGTVTALPAAGSVVDRGQMLFEIDGNAIPLFFGDRPFWRPMARNTKGQDVAELEANLAALGYGDSGLVVDTKFDAATERAVKRWQDTAGRDKTGVVQPADAVVLPAAVRVAEHKTEVGSSAQPGGPIVSVTGTARIVTVRLDTNKRSFVRGGDAVRVALPSGRVIGAKVAIVGRVANTNGNANGDTTARVDVVVVLDDVRTVGDLDEAPVDVHITRASAKHVLAVPVRALLALTEGGYAVEVQGAAGRHLVGVETGTYADGWVQVTGAVHAGDRVVVAQ
jgi:peptidoglycan hydrolase-like protein with peptidoglycan-binding domain